MTMNEIFFKKCNLEHQKQTWSSRRKIPDSLKLFSQQTTQEKRIKKREQSLCETRDIKDRNSLYFIKVQEVAERKKTENISKEIMAGNFPNLIRGLYFQDY